ncbi:MAG: transposase [Treponema sp.]|jgi:hypothetical protein|nr:transposase [Treponema sp.]
MINVPSDAGRNGGHSELQPCRLKSEHTRRSAYVDEEDARVRMALWLAYYNSERLHRAIGYLTPDDVFYGRRDSRLAEREEKLHTARINRQEYWKAKAANPDIPYMLA